MCEMANYLDGIGDYRNAALLDSTARTIMKYVD